MNEHNYMLYCQISLQFLSLTDGSALACKGQLNASTMLWLVVCLKGFVKFSKPVAQSFQCSTSWCMLFLYGGCWWMGWWMGCSQRQEVGWLVLVTPRDGRKTSSSGRLLNWSLTRRSLFLWTNMWATIYQTNGLTYPWNRLLPFILLITTAKTCVLIGAAVIGNPSQKIVAIFLPYHWPTRGKYILDSLTVSPSLVPKWSHFQFFLHNY